MSKKITLSADGASATVANATLSDIATTLVSTDSVVTGAYGLLQKGLLVVAGMGVQHYRLTGRMNPFKVA